jgi:hypothetical protein
MYEDMERATGVEKEGLKDRVVISVRLIIVVIRLLFALGKKKMSGKDGNMRLSFFYRVELPFKLPALARQVLKGYKRNS